MPVASFAHPERPARPPVVRCAAYGRACGWCCRMLAAALLSVVAASAPAASGVVISQVYGGGGNAGAYYRNDFVELFNRGAAPVGLKGWSVQYAPSSGGSWSVTALPAVTLQPGQYLLVQGAAGAGGTAALPAADVTGTLALAATAGRVLLANTAAAVAGPGAPSVVDLVGFGPAGTAHEGAGPAVAPSNTMAILRARDGCADTDDNRADFAAAMPAPRNGASAFNLCAAGNAPITALCPDR